MSLHIGSSNISDIYVGNSKISDIYVGNDLVYTSNKGPDLTVPLYFEPADPSVAVAVGFRKGSTENTSDPSSIDFSKYTGYSDPAWSYSYDAVTWSNYTIGNNITIGGSNPSRVYFKSRTNYTAIPWRGSYTDSSSKVTTTYYTFLQFTASGGNVNASGNIQSLLYSDFTAYDSVLAYCFYYMFSGCTSLTKNPSLPATTLADGCYWLMFQRCTSLTSAPALPATTLANFCYTGMFNLGIRANGTASAPCVYPYRIPESGTGTDGETSGLGDMFADIDGIGTFTPTINTTFYISVPVAN